MTTFELLIAHAPYSAEGLGGTAPSEFAPPRNWKPIFRAVERQIAHINADKWLAKFGAAVENIARAPGGIDAHVYVVDATAGLAGRRPVRYWAIVDVKKAALKALVDGFDQGYAVAVESGEKPEPPGDGEQVGAQTGESETPSE